MQKCEDIVTGETKYISCGPAPSDIEEENMVLKTLQMFMADYDLAPYCFWWVAFEGKKFQQECKEGRIPQ